jgi:hypothetical protein
MACGGGTEEQLSEAEIERRTTRPTAPAAE